MFLSIIVFLIPSYILFITLIISLFIIFTFFTTITIMSVVTIHIFLLNLTRLAYNVIISSKLFKIKYKTYDKKKYYINIKKP
jgi:hypothetical protein